MKMRTPGGRLAALLLTLLVAAACGDDITFPPEFDSSLGIALTTMTKTPSGLYYKDLVTGTGDTAASGDQVTVSYTGWFPSGVRFDSGSFPFTLGTGQVIPGFDEGVTGMAVGGKRQLVIPPELGYGARGSGGIPPNTTLVFEVELTALN